MSQFVTRLQQTLYVMFVAPPADDVPENEIGSEMVQMALILGLVVIVAIGMLQALGVNIVGKFGEVVAALGG